jgi:proliferating cell nuclear antigen
MESIYKKKTAFIIIDKRKKDAFISIFQLLKNSTSQINLTINKTTFHVQGMDKSHVCLFDLKLSFEWFDYYEVNEKYELCFDTGTFYSIISTKADEQSLVFYLDDDNLESLIIELKNIDNNGENNSKKPKSTYNKYFKLPLLDYDYEQMIIPNTEYEAEFTVSSKNISDMLCQLNNFGDDINIKCTDDKVVFKTVRDALEMRVDIIVEDLDSYAVIEGEDVNLSYSLIYITKMCITNKLSNNIDFSLSNECPMKINYNLGKESLLTFYIAPKLTDD